MFLGNVVKIVVPFHVVSLLPNTGYSIGAGTWLLQLLPASIVASRSSSTSLSVVTEVLYIDGGSWNLICFRTRARTDAVWLTNIGSSWGGWITCSPFVRKAFKDDHFLFISLPLAKVLFSNVLYLGLWMALKNNRIIQSTEKMLDWNVGCRSSSFPSSFPNDTQANTMASLKEATSNVFLVTSEW